MTVPGAIALSIAIIVVGVTMVGTALKWLAPTRISGYCQSCDAHVTNWPRCEPCQCGGKIGKRATKSKTFRLTSRTVAGMVEQIGPGQRHNFLLSPVAAFKADRLVVSQYIAPYFIVESILIGRRYVLSSFSGGVPAEAFSRNAPRRQWPEAQASQPIQVTVRNLHPRDHIWFRGWLEGEQSD